MFGVGSPGKLSTQTCLPFGDPFLGIHSSIFDIWDPEHDPEHLLRQAQAQLQLICGNEARNVRTQSLKLVHS